ncbi:MAG: hypothetical protein WC011_03590 [Candidatus Paceibacterota bacterium]
MKSKNIDFKFIRKIPFWWEYFPFLSIDMARTIYPYIYFPKDIFIDLQSESPKDLNFSILIHEKVHIDRQEKLGILKWNIFYLFSKKFRLNEEIVAILEQMKYMKSKNLSYDFAKKARQFSSSTYLWMIPYERGLDLLNNLWTKAD